jgi:N-hydroxyarylamine O-acetyltransferase
VIVKEETQHLQSMDKREYLKRINYRGNLNPTIEVLGAIQEAHLLSVPFENLDIRLRRTIELDLARLYTKIVANRRGGFCYELNALFHWLLRELGFHATMISARVYDSSRNDYGPEFDHMAIIVDLAGRSWLVDVGFGEFSMRPLKFVVNERLTDRSGDFRIEKDHDDCFRVSKYSEEHRKYIPEYLFSTKERDLKDFKEMCLFHQTSPDSHFTQKMVCSIATKKGRTTLTGDKLLFTEKGIRSQLPIRGEQELNSALQRYFNITL